MGGDEQLRVNTTLVRTGAQSAATARAHLDDLPDGLARTAGNVESAVPGSRTSLGWGRTGRHCAAHGQAEIQQLRGFARALLVAAALIDATDRRLASAMPRHPGTR